MIGVENLGQNSNIYKYYTKIFEFWSTFSKYLLSFPSYWPAMLNANIFFTLHKKGKKNV